MIDHGNDERVKIDVGETVLVPASLKNIQILPDGLTRLLEIFLK